VQSRVAACRKVVGPEGLEPPTRPQKIRPWSKLYKPLSHKHFYTKNCARKACVCIGFAGFPEMKMHNTAQECTLSFQDTSPPPPRPFKPDQAHPDHLGAARPGRGARITCHWPTMSAALGESSPGRVLNIWVSHTHMATSNIRWPSTSRCYSSKISADTDVYLWRIQYSGSDYPGHRDH
jgi:hypothetical protein